MPDFSIKISAFDPNKSIFSECDLRYEKIISNYSQRKNIFTRQDYIDACNAIKEIMTDYNKGLRGHPLHYRNINESKKNTKEKN